MSVATEATAKAIDPDYDKAFQKIADMAKVDGVEAELLVEMSESLSLAVDHGRVERFASSTAQAGGLRVIDSGVEGYCWTESLSERDLAEAYHEALANARFAARGTIGSNDPAELVELYSGETVTEQGELFNASLEQFSIQEKIQRAQSLESEAKAFDSRIASVPYNRYWESRGEVQIFNTRGVRARQRSTALGGFAYCLAKQGNESRMGGEMFFSRDANVAPVEAVARSAAQKAILKLGAVSPTTGLYPVMIDSEAVAEFFGTLAGYFSAKAVAENSSLFGDERGKLIASPLLTIRDEPFLNGGIGNRPFDSEGVPTRPTTLVENGVLQTFLTNSFYSRKLKLPHTASAVRSAKDQLQIGHSNLVIVPGESSREEMLSAYGRIVHITDFKDFHAGFRLGSGEFSLSAEGDLYENGERVGALCNFVVSGSVRDLFSRIVRVGSRLSPTNRSVVAPDLLISELSIAGSGS